jgi:hypothetical protein
MKKLIVVCGFIASMVGMANAQIRVGAKAGVNFSKIDYQDKTLGDVLNSSSTSYFFGGVLEFPFLGKLHLQPGLLLNGQAGNVGTGVDKVTLNMMYAEVPLNILGRADLGIGSFYLGGGPYAAYAISGKIKTSGISEKIVFGNTVDDFMKPTDYGINVLTGLDLRGGLSLGLGYKLGLSDNAPKTFTQALNSKNSSFSVSIGYMLKL